MKLLGVILVVAGALGVYLFGVRKLTPAQVWGSLSAFVTGGSGAAPSAGGGNAGL